MQGNSHFVFDADHELIELVKKIDQSKDLTNHYPSIKTPAPGGYVTKLLQALEEGGHFFNVLQKSDLPKIGVLPQKRLKNPQAPEGDYWMIQDIVWIGADPVKIIDPIEKPILFPPMCRYTMAADGNIDLVNIGGERDNANISPADSYFAYDMYVEFSKNFNPKTVDPTECIRFKNTAAITHDKADTANARYVKVPAFDISAGMKTRSGIGSTTGTPTKANWIPAVYHSGKVSGNSKIAVANLSLADITALSDGNKMKMDVEIQAAAGDHGVIVADSFIEFCRRVA